jgi:flavodoxin
MKVAVRYFSLSGNTAKIGEAIAQAVNVEALPIMAELEKPVDLLFLGSAVYAFGIDDILKTFIDELEPSRVKKVAIFSTTALVKSAYPLIKKALDAKGIPVADEEFHCRGEFKIFHKGRPNQQDCDAAVEFARKLIQKG